MNKKRLIDANDIDLRWLAWLRHADGSDYSDYEHGYNDAVVSCIGQIESAPTIDAVEVVRCKDCKHYRPRNISAHWEHKALCCARSAWIKFPEDGFCSYGERKEDHEP